MKNLKNNLKKLRKEIILNSLFLADYENSFNVSPEDCCDFFDGFLNYYDDLEIDQVDNIENLLNYYLIIENNKLKKYLES